jgi:pimeloyl-ACP methyl ester carboxylesterase
MNSGREVPVSVCAEQLQLRIHGDASLPTLVYLPGLHGDWTLVTSFRLALGGRVRFVEFTFPRTLTWSLDDYANAVEEALLAHGITHGWLLAESFSSQVAWPLIAGGRSRAAGHAPIDQGGGGTPPSQASFQADGLILAGGFVKHPVNWAVRLAERFAGGVSLTWLTRLLFFYARFARWRHRHAPETLASIHEFIARRTELDKQAAKHRLHLVAHADFRPIARQITFPVFQLAGCWDPIVPWPLVRPWLRRHCPGFRDSRIIRYADHNVLGTAPREAADLVLEWMGVVER